MYELQTVYICSTLSLYFRQKKARKEAEKLTHIQKELMILDNLLSADVTVIRNRIESASRDYLEATYVFKSSGDVMIHWYMDIS